MTDMRAAVAQSVERRLGKAEVGGSIPLGSLDSLFGSLFFYQNPEWINALFQKNIYDNIPSLTVRKRKKWRIP